MRGAGPVAEGRFIPFHQEVFQRLSWIELLLMSAAKEGRVRAGRSGVLELHNLP